MNLEIETIVPTLESRRKLKKDAKKCKVIDYKTTKFENFDEIEKEDFECVICMAFIAEPIITPCKHIFCLTCFEESQEIKDECPMCRQNLKYYGPEVDQKLQKYLEDNYTEEFEDRKQALKDQEIWTGDMFCVNFIFENDWEEVRNSTVNRLGHSLKNKYTIAFRDMKNTGDINKIVESIEIYYPETYKNNIRTLKEENGWKLTDCSWEDSIEVQAKINFKTWTGFDPCEFAYEITFDKEGNYVCFKSMLPLDDWNSYEESIKNNNKNSLKNQAIQALK